MAKLLYKKGDEDNFNKILTLLLNEIKSKVEKLKTSDIFFDLSILQNYVIFFMIITINLKSYPQFINNVFNGPTKFFKQLVKLFTVLSKPKKKILLGILNNLFLEEYKMIYFREERDEALEDLFIQQQTAFSSIYIDMMSYYEDKTYFFVALLHLRAQEPFRAARLSFHTAGFSKASSENIFSEQS